MEFLRSISLIWAMTFMLMLFLILCDFRFDRRKSIWLSVAAMAPLIVLTAVLCVVIGTEAVSKLIVVTLTIPSLIFFSFMVKKRDAKFFFAFCFGDTIGTEIIVLTNLLDTWVGDGKAIVLFVTRLILCPLTVWAVWKYIRKPFKELRMEDSKGWWLCAAVTMLFYVLIFVMVSIPTFITERPEDVPGLLLMFLLMPLTYVALLKMLFDQMLMYREWEVRSNEAKLNQILQNELTMEKEYIEQARCYRHDVRHILHITRTYLTEGKYAEAAEYLREYDVSLDESVLPFYCENKVANALLYITERRCANDKVKFCAKAEIPQKLPYSAVESGVLLGNLLENAYEAARKCNGAFLHVEATVQNGKLLLTVRNSVSGPVRFREGLPVTTKKGGGVGVQSMVRLLDRYGGMIKMQQSGDVFVTQIVQNL